MTPGGGRLSVQSRRSQSREILGTPKLGPRGSERAHRVPQDTDRPWGAAAWGQTRVPVGRAALPCLLAEGLLGVRLGVARIPPRVLTVQEGRRERRGAGRPEGTVGLGRWQPRSDTATAQAVDMGARYVTRSSSRKKSSARCESHPGGESGSGEHGGPLEQQAKGR